MKLKTTFIALTVFSFAAVAGPHHKHHEDKYDRIAEKLELTESQQVQLKEVMQAKHEKIKAAMELIHNETKAELSAFLSDEQVEKLQKRMEKRKEMRKFAKAHKKMHKGDR